MNYFKKLLNIIISTCLLVVSLAGSVKETPEFFKWVYELLPIQIWIFLLLISFIPLGYYLFRKNRFVRWLVFGKDKRIRIAILLPMTHDNDFVREDAELQLQGFGKTLTEIRDNLMNFDLKYLDHENDPNIARKLVIKELKLGTKYFLCTMSGVCIEISKIFAELDKKYGDDRAVLICTVCGASEVETSKDKVYRFYIHLKDEIETLITHITEKDNKKAGIIYFNSSPYANACMTLFKEKWNESVANKANHISVDDTIQLKINRSNEIDNILKGKKVIIEDRDIIFIVAYGHAYLDVLESIISINKNALIVMTSTFSFKHWQSKVMSILNNFDWLSCKPVLKNKEEFRDENDVVTYFSMNTLERLTQVIIDIKINGGSFDEQWNKCKVPGKLLYSKLTNKEGDYKIELTSKKRQV